MDNGSLIVDHDGSHWLGKAGDGYWLMIGNGSVVVVMRFLMVYPRGCNHWLMMVYVVKDGSSWFVIDNHGQLMANHSGQ